MEIIFKKWVYFIMHWKALLIDDLFFFCSKKDEI